MGGQIPGRTILPTCRTVISVLNILSFHCPRVRRADQDKVTRDLETSSLAMRSTTSTVKLRDCTQSGNRAPTAEDARCPGWRNSGRDGPDELQSAGPKNQLSR